MKKTLLVIACTLIISAAFASEPATKTLTVVVKGIETATGKVSVTLFTSEESWLEQGINQTVSITKNGQVTIVFEKVPAGKYAVSVIHDTNGNGDLDTGTFGIPSEPYGFSNDARGRFGPASFDDSSFELSKDLEISITVE